MAKRVGETKRVGDTKPVGVTNRVGETKPVGVTNRVGETKPVGVTKRVGETKPVATHPLSTEVYDLNNIFELLSGDFCSYYTLFSFSVSLFILFFIFYFFICIFNVYHLSNLCFRDLLTFPSPSQSLSTSHAPKDINQPAKISAAKPTQVKDISQPAKTSAAKPT